MHNHKSQAVKVTHYLSLLPPFTRQENGPIPDRIRVTESALVSEDLA